MFKELKNSVLVFVMLTGLTGVLYPLLVTAIAQTFFNKQANGSLIIIEGKVVDSKLIGQPINETKSFWSRVSATAPSYNAGASSGSNYGPMNPALKDVVSSRVKALKDADPSNANPIPVDLVTASASGLDPHISQASAFYQTARIARIRNISEEKIKEIIQRNTQNRFLGVVGEPVVNVLEANLDLDGWKKA